MNDGVTKNIGNSRYLRGAGWPATYEEFRQLAAAGKLPFDLAGINPAGWAVIGDALNKGNLLPDDVAAALGLSGNPQVKDALRLSKDIGRIRAGSVFYDACKPIISGVVKESALTTPFTSLYFTHDFARCVCVDNTAKEICVVDTSTWRKLVTIPQDQTLSSNNDAIAYATDSYMVVSNTGTYSNTMSFRIYRYTDSSITLVTTKTITGISYNHAGNCTGWNIPDGRYLYMFAAHNDDNAYVRKYVFDTTTNAFVVDGSYVFSGAGNSAFVLYTVTGDNICYLASGTNRSGQGVKIYRLLGNGQAVVFDKSALYSGSIAYDEKQKLLFFYAGSEIYKFDARNGSLLSSATNVPLGNPIAKDGFLYGANKIVNYNFEDFTDSKINLIGCADAMRVAVSYGGTTAYALGHVVTDKYAFFLEELGVILLYRDGGRFDGTSGKGKFQYLMGYSK